MKKKRSKKKNLFFNLSKIKIVKNRWKEYMDCKRWSTYYFGGDGDLPF